MKMKRGNMNKTGIYKFVKLENGEYIFEALESKKEHKQLVPEGEKAIAAGTIVIGEKSLSIVDNKSLSLKLGFTDKNKAELSTLLGKKWK